MIKFDNVTFQYEQNKPIFHDFHATFEQGVVNVLMGNSGVGKSTLLSLAMQLLTAENGTISCGQCACVFQQSRLVEEITVFGNIELVLLSCYKDKKQRKELIMNALASLNMLDLANRFPSQLSGGQRQRVSLLRAFLYPSNTILLDEPFKGLDSSIKKQLCNTFVDLLSFDNQRTILFVTHDVEVAMAIGDIIFRLNGAPAKLDKLHDLYNVDKKQRNLYSQYFNDLRQLLNQELNK